MMRLMRPSKFYSEPVLFVFFFYIDHRKLTKLSPPIIKETWS